MEYYLWIDLETTGLNPNLCEVVEIAAVLTTAEMKIVAEYESLVQTSNRLSWQPAALAMHARNGLIERWSDGEKRHIETRSEEHTSELQSRPHLVCRLLLEKKKK